jgi:hypothetical protein
VSRLLPPLTLPLPLPLPFPFPVRLRLLIYLEDVSSFFCFCESGDLILLLSDGAWANFDPLTLGSPSSFGYKAEKWEELRSDETQSDIVEVFRNNQITATLRKLILSALNSVLPSPSSPVSPSPTSSASLPPLPTASLASRVTARVIRHCQEVIASTRDWIEDHPNERMPESTDFKGKMDHCTCLVVKVGTGAFVSTPVPIGEFFFSCLTAVSRFPSLL